LDLAAPADRDGGVAVVGTAEGASDRAGGVGVAAETDGGDEGVLEGGGL
jgi:hypothetical protein